MNDPASPAASKTAQDFGEIDTTGMASAEPGPFVPDHSEFVVRDDGVAFWSFCEAKDLNPGPLYPSSNAGRQSEWLRRNPKVEGEMTLVIGPSTQLADSMRRLILDARSGVGGFDAVDVVVLRKDSVTGEFFEVVVLP